VFFIRKQLRQMNENKRYRNAGSSFHSLFYPTFRDRSGLRSQAVFREVVADTEMAFRACEINVVTT